MRLLIGARDKSRLFHWEEFGRTLSKFDVECKVVNNIDIVDGFPTKKMHKWGGTMKRFNRLVHDFNPDVIMTDGLRHFGTASLKSGIPLILYLAGDFWTEIKCAKETKYRSFPRSLAISRLEQMGNKILHNSRVVMPISKYLDEIVREKLPGKPTYVLRRMMDPSIWHPEEGMNLKHPCVGMVQKATIRDKAKEMLVLSDVLERLPNVTFYWAGSGPYTEEILHELEKYPNFQWLGALDYPDGVRRFLSEIDIYALFTGLETASISIREALLMEKPVVATNVGGIPEIMEAGKSGMLVNAGDPDGIVEKVSHLLDNPALASQMAKYGRTIAAEDTDRENIARGFVEYVGTELGLQ